MNSVFYVIIFHDWWSGIIIYPIRVKFMPGNFELAESTIFCIEVLFISDKKIYQYLLTR